MAQSDNQSYSWADLTEHSQFDERQTLLPGPLSSKDSSNLYSKKTESCHKRELDRKRGQNEYQSSRPKYTERAGNLSPLRSPVNRRKRTSIMDMDNSRNFRYFTKKPESVGSPSDMTEPTERTFFSDSDNEESRRRLHLPSESDDTNHRNSGRLPVIEEDDKVRLARREKDVAYGKNTDAYKLYVEIIPRHKRTENWKINPRTPQKYKKCSRRSWDSRVKLWRRRLHLWAENYHREMDDSDFKAQSSSQTSLEGAIASEDDGYENQDDLSGNSDEVKEYEDAFLDSDLEISYAVAEKIEETVSINDA